MQGNKHVAKLIKEISKNMPVFDQKYESNYIQFTVPILIGADDVIDGASIRLPSAYHRQIMTVTVQITNDYPNSCPSLCLPPNLIFHPFIDQASGSVCMDTRCDKWNPKNANQLVVRLLTIDIPHLLGTFEGDNPHNPSADSLYKEDPEKYFSKACKEYKSHQSAMYTSRKLYDDMIKYKLKQFPEPFVAHAKQVGIKLPELTRPQRAEPIPYERVTVNFDDSQCSGSY